MKMLDIYKRVNRYPIKHTKSHDDNKYNRTEKHKKDWRFDEDDREWKYE